MAAFKTLNTDEPRDAVARRAGVALSGLAVLATVLITVGAAAPPGSPLRVVVPATVAAAEPAHAASAATSCDDAGYSSFTREGELQIQRPLSDGVRLCARVRGPVRFEPRSGAIRELPVGSSLLVETRTAKGASQRMLVTRDEGELRQQWWRDGASRPVDDAAQAWLADALEVVAADREVGALQGEVGRLQGQIGRVQGEVGRLQGEIGRIQGEIGALQGRVGRVQGERGSLQGEIGSHQGAIGSLQGSRWNASPTREKQIETEIAEHEAAIRKLEARLESSEITQRLSGAEAELAAFEESSRGRIAELERQIDAIRSEDRIGALEKQIEDLHADDQIDEIKRRVAPAAERLAARVRAFGS